jgi:hypothetical protein
LVNSANKPLGLQLEEVAMANDKKRTRVIKLTLEERIGLRKVFEQARYKVSFHRGYMRIERDGLRDDISYNKIRSFQGAVIVKRR